jgi:hypothetical protein
MATDSDFYCIHQLLMIHIVPHAHNHVSYRCYSTTVCYCVLLWHPYKRMQHATVALLYVTYTPPFSV